MKIEIEDARPSEDFILTWDTIKTCPGVYKPKSNHSVRLVVQEWNVFFVYKTNSQFQPASEGCWKHDRFVKVPERVTVTFE